MGDFVFHLVEVAEVDYSDFTILKGVHRVTLAEVFNIGNGVLTKDLLLFILRLMNEPMKITKPFNVLQKLSLLLRQHDEVLHGKSELFMCFLKFFLFPQQHLLIWLGILHILGFDYQSLRMYLRLLLVILLLYLWDFHMKIFLIYLHI